MAMPELAVPAAAECRPEASVLPDLTWIKRHIPIVEVARELGIHATQLGGAQWVMVRCFHPERHKNGDRTPSLGLNRKSNRYLCLGCGDRTHSNVDLVMEVEGVSLARAIRWFDERYPGIPRKRMAPNAVFEFRVGVDEFTRPEDLVKAGLVPHLTNAGLRVFTVIAAFRDANNVSEISYHTIKMRSGLTSDATISKAIKHLEGLSIFEKRSQYVFSFDDPGLFAMLAGRDLKKEGG